MGIPRRGRAQALNHRRSRFIRDEKERATQLEHKSIAPVIGLVVIFLGGIALAVLLVMRKEKLQAADPPAAR